MTRAECEMCLHLRLDVEFVLVVSFKSLLGASSIIKSTFDMNSAISTRPTRGPCQCYDVKKYRWTTSDSTGLARGVRSRLCGASENPNGEWMPMDAPYVDVLEPRPLPTDLPSWLTRSFKV